MAGYVKNENKLLERFSLSKIKRILTEALYNTGYERYYNKKPPRGMTLAEKKRKVDARDRERKKY